MGIAHPPQLISEPPSTDGGLDGDQCTQVGSPLSGPATGGVESCDSDGVATRSENINSRSLVPLTDLSQLSPRDYSAAPRWCSVSGRPSSLSVTTAVVLVLQHLGATERDCSGDYPGTLAKASCCLDTARASAGRPKGLFTPAQRGGMPSPRLSGSGAV